MQVKIDHSNASKSLRGKGLLKMAEKNTNTC